MLCKISFVCVDDGRVLREFYDDIALYSVRKWRNLYHLLDDYQKRDLFVKLIILPYSEQPF